VPIRPAIPVADGSKWAQRLTEPGWLLLPLRLFLGITFCYAGLQKLANPAYLDPHSPTSVVGQMRLLQHSSPIGGLLSISQHAPTLVGLSIALGELAVGVGTLVGLFSRIAAIGGALLSLTFFLTVSWNTTPYYYGSDIVFVFAWLTMFAFGDTGVVSLQTWLRGRAREPVRDRRGRLQPRAAAEVERRTVVFTLGWGALVAGVTGLTAGLTALIGRAAARTPSVAGAPQPLGSSHTRHPHSSAASSPARSAGPTAPGTALGPVTAVPVGQARSFTDPASGYPAWVVHPSGNTFVAFSAICTHAGCEVQYEASTVQFVCPCHGGVYDARTGAVRSGPPPAPLQRIPLTVANGQLRVDT
jgi:thiosulfate dehydrogenase [quinone] large subunit